MPSFRGSRRTSLWSAALCALALLAPSAPALAGDPPPPVADTPLFGIVDSYREPKEAQAAGSTWDRVLFLWQQIQPDDKDQFDKDYLPQKDIKEANKRGIQMTAVLQGTPQWAALNSPDGAGAVPRNLDADSDSRKNYWGRFVEQMVDHYDGRIGAWIIWNEPDFQPGDPGDWWTWAGSGKDYYELLKDAYQVIKKEDPEAKVVFASTAFWPDVTSGRDLFLKRVLDAADDDPDAKKNGYFFDAVGLNLYCSDRAIYSVKQEYDRILAEHGLEKPIWLTETNCAPYDDPERPMPPESRITQEEQASYLVRAMAMARAAGYGRIAWYSMVDRPSLADPWGLIRESGKKRPAYYAYQTVTRLLGNDRRVYLASAEDVAQQPTSLPVARVVAEGNGSRVEVLWNTSPNLLSVRLPARGTSARLLDPVGADIPLKRQDGWWQLDLAPGRAPQPSDPPGYRLDGRPLMLIEQGVQQGDPLPPLRLGPLPAAARNFPQTGYSVENDAIWAAYQRFGGEASFGRPLSFEFPLQGRLVQLFENGALRVDADGVARPAPLPATALRSVHITSVPLPPIPAHPAPATSPADAVERIQREVPARLREVYYGGVRCQPAVRCDARMLAIERFGLPLGPAVMDPSAPDRLYQRFENGVLWADGRSGGQVPLGRLLRKVLIGARIAPELHADLRDGPLYGQYDPGLPLGMLRPNAAPGTNLRAAF